MDFSRQWLLKDACTPAFKKNYVSKFFFICDHLLNSCRIHSELLPIWSSASCRAHPLSPSPESLKSLGDQSPQHHPVLTHTDLVEKWREMEMGSLSPHGGTDCFLNYLKWWRKRTVYNPGPRVTFEHVASLLLYILRESSQGNILP